MIPAPLQVVDSDLQSDVDDVALGVSAADLKGVDRRVSVASVPGRSSLAFAHVDVDGCVIDASDVFYTLLGFSTPSAGASLTDHAAVHFRASAARLHSALGQSDAAVVVLEPPGGGTPIRVHLDHVIDGGRAVLAECEQEAEDVRQARYAQSHLDPLTGLGNRRLLSESIDAWVPGGSRAASLAVIMLDLDRFKNVNDTLGHGAGDVLLKLVADRITRAARTADTIVRMGGDEFIILHSIGEQPSGAESLATRLVDLLGRPFLVEGQQVNIGTSIGIALYDPEKGHTDDLLKHADLALYDAKQSGRNCYRLFDPSLEERALERRELELQLRRALNLREFELHYQPQTELSTGELSGFEALIRWNSASRGMVSPVDFIPLAEEIGEIVPIGDWVLRTACQQAASWPESLCVAVNVSPAQFANPRLVDSIQEALAISGLAPERLEIEITEGVLFGDVEQATDQLWAIHSMGVQIAMDDFGTGYSSLSHLNSFPFSKIKIDQSFVRGEQTPKSRALVNAIISLGTSLGMKTLAEGVETPDQYADLANGGCLEAQGYLISKPMPVGDIDTFIQNFEEKKLSLGSAS